MPRWLEFILLREMRVRNGTARFRRPADRRARICGGQTTRCESDMVGGHEFDGTVDEQYFQSSGFQFGDRIFTRVEHSCDVYGDTKFNKRFRHNNFILWSVSKSKRR